MIPFNVLITIYLNLNDTKILNKKIVTVFKNIFYRSLYFNYNSDISAVYDHNCIN